MTYECHITFELEAGGNPVELEHDIIRTGWHYSRIQGDPDLGKGTKHYATTHLDDEDNELVNVISFMNAIASDLENDYRKVVRQKVELIVYDTKGK